MNNEINYPTDAVIKFYKCLFGENGEEYVKNNIALASNNLHKYFEYLSNDLDEREIEIIKYRFGFNGKIYTLREIGEIYNLSSERIRQIEGKTIRKLKHPSRRIAGTPILLGIDK